MDSLTVFLTLAVPVGGWVLYVERRLGELLAIKCQLASVDAKVDRLVEHLLGKS